MRKSCLMMIGLMVALIVTASSGASKDQVGEPSGNLKQAVNTIRLINTAEAHLGVAGKTFLTLSELSSAGVLRETAKMNEDLGSAYDRLDLQNQAEPLKGFEFDMVVASDGKTYKLSLAQKVECGLAVFSDNRGLIYLGRALGCSNK
jgi:hypothetical protein